MPSASLNCMDTVSWASSQLAVVSERRKALETELLSLDRLTAELEKLIPTEEPSVPAPVATITRKQRTQSRDPKRNGDTTKAALKLLENGPMTLTELATALRARRKTGIASALRFQEKKGNVLLTDGKFSLPRTIPAGVLVG